LAWAYFYEKKYPLALKTAQEAEMLMQQYAFHSDAPALHPCIQAGTYSTLALMQARNRLSPESALGKSTEVDPGNEPYAMMTSKRSALLIEAGWTYCYAGNPKKAQEMLGQRIDPETLSPRIAQSEMGRVETITILALSSLQTNSRDMKQTIHWWTAGIQGAIALKNEQRFNEALATYDLMEIVWPGEKDVKDLRELIVHW
jgi:hypothetical protein